MSQSNTEKAYNHLRKKILEGALEPGDHLQTIDLSKEIGVSRTPVRDALRMLEQDGLVSIESRTGAKVRSLELNDFRELCEVRQALEGFCAGLAAKNHSPNDLDQIEEHLKNMAVVVAKLPKLKKPLSMLSELAQEDSRFHLGISAASGNGLFHRDLIRLHLIFRVLAGRTGKLESIPNVTKWLQRRKDIHEEHNLVFDAIKGRDPKRAREAMEAHISKISKEEILILERREREKQLHKLGI